MNMKRITSAVLSLVMALGAIVPASIQPVSAAWEDKVDSDGKPIIKYTTDAYTDPEAKLADMIMVREQNGHQIWFEEFTGEIAYKDLASGQILFSNPWDIAATYNKATDSTKSQLLSQLIITFTDNGAQKTMYSYTEAALRGQITYKNIKNGIRVEYMMGEEKTTRLVPRMIEKSRFEKLILEPIKDDFQWGKVESFYSLKDPFDSSLTDRQIIEMQTAFPATQTMAIYTYSDNAKAKEIKTVENIIKTWCTEYSYEELEYDHDMTGYSGDDAAPPLFKLAIEYTITPDGDLEARLPANGIRFDESAYQLKTVALLPYFGAGSNAYTGYTMIPDGSGTLIRYEDVKGGYNVSGQMYGADYAYHTISNQHTQTMRWPVYGNVTNYDKTWKEDVEVVVSEETTDEDGKVVPAVTKTEKVERELKQSNGFLAIITEGDSLTSLMSSHGGSLHSFNTVYPIFTPRPSDSYNLAASISVGANTSWTVESERKYTGSYRILFKMLTDDKVAETNNLTNTYSADYVGMAKAYRDYLYQNGALTALADTTDNIPLYIETFGSTVTTKRILSFPVEVDVPLTTFEDIKAMYDELTEMGVGRINFRLTGYANGGMYATMPYHLKWDDVVGGADGFRDLIAYSNEKNFGIFPDFDFAYMGYSEFGDGVNLRKHAVKTIDDRYTSKRNYDAATQSFSSIFSLCISPSVYEYFYNKFASNYAKYEPKSISVSSLGTDLNSDFDEDEPYNREDSKKFTMEILQKIDADYENVMINGGNAYTLPYANHIAFIATDSSRYLQASEAIPFIGMVLHGSKYFSGSPINMEGDIKSAILKAIENGSSLYFILSKQNTSLLKEDMLLSAYYSVSYDIWKDEVVEHYNTLNDVTKDLQTSKIVDHEFLFAERIPDADEIAADEAAVLKAEEEAKEAEAKKKEEQERERLFAELHGLTYVAPVETPEEDVTDDTTEETEPVEEESTEYVKTKYTTTSGSVVRVEYEGGVNFLLNYNSFDITVKYNGTTYTIEALGFVRID